jgi:hypothetical protein
VTVNNFNITNNHFLPSLTEDQKRKTHLMTLEIQVQMCGGVKPVNGIQIFPS